MMGFQGTPARLFYDFCLDEHVPSDHLLRGVDRQDVPDHQLGIDRGPAPFGCKTASAIGGDHRGRGQGHVEAGEVLHFPLLGLPYRVP